MATQSRHYLVYQMATAELRATVRALVTLLSAQAGLCRAGSMRPEAVYAWWGPRRTSNRLGVLALQELLRPAEEWLADGNDAVVCLTDRHSLYAGMSTDISWDDERSRDPESCFPADRQADLGGDYYFRLADMRELIVRDANAVASALNALLPTGAGPELAGSGRRRSAQPSVVLGREHQLLLGAPLAATGGEFVLWAEEVALR